MVAHATLPWGSRRTGWTRLRTSSAVVRVLEVAWCECLHASDGLYGQAEWISLFDHTRPPPCARSYLGSCSSGNDELARPSQAADHAARSECVSAGVPDALGPSPWISQASK